MLLHSGFSFSTVPGGLLNWVDAFPRGRGRAAGRRPADVDDDEVAERGLLADHSSRSRRDVGGLPVEACVEAAARPAAMSAARIDCAKSSSRSPCPARAGRARRRAAAAAAPQASGRRRRTRSPHRASASGQLLHAGAEHDAGNLVSEARGLREHRQRALLQLPLVMLEEDEGAPYEPLLREELGDLLGAGAVVIELPRLSAGWRIGEREHLDARPSRRHDRVDPEVGERADSCCFFLAPMIPFSEGSAAR